MIREPAVAGEFYSFDPDSLSKELDACFEFSGAPTKRGNDKKILAIVAPHAGYAYSGGIAAFAYKALAEDRTPETAVILGPNHTGFGKKNAIYPEGSWQTPLGELEVDTALVDKIADSNYNLDYDAHRYEHSIEVQLPFLQRLYGDEVKIVPICLSVQTLGACMDLGLRLAQALDPEKHVVIASTDFTHYETNESACKKDLAAIDAIKGLEARELEEKIRALKISMCGPGGVIAAINYASLKGAREGKLLRYATSGDVTGDTTQVVGYAAIALVR